ncbi:hypothetical protein BKA82DRAFT_1006709 [Pisolithus tinctorius]|uniref:Uncharacterized protein n=1 Tax=Pisolithus tinctorius Marx 270 TaxID=870435 RepID=A0A0C3JFX9_PISTI|nr:hypothetical protein BKA82DRAFT_1006709 [Pisolithus tinctorius]KIN96531.1 hypothetical protein M404DRAFT_1006709 [Pisolithus tinctorius Marx 270]
MDGFVQRPIALSSWVWSVRGCTHIQKLPGSNQVYTLREQYSQTLVPAMHATPASLVVRQDDFESDRWELFALVTNVHNPLFGECVTAKMGSAIASLQFPSHEIRTSRA